MAAGRFDEAGELYAAADAIAPDSDELLFWAGLARAQAGDLDAGVAAVRRAAEINAELACVAGAAVAGVRAGGRGRASGSG